MIDIISRVLSRHGLLRRPRHAVALVAAVTLAGACLAVAPASARTGLAAALGSTWAGGRPVRGWHARRRPARRKAAGPTPASLAGASPLLTRAPYLTDVTSSSVRVTWATSVQATEAVKYGTPGHCMARTAHATGPGTPIDVNGVTEYQNSVALTGLPAGSTRCYRITTGGFHPVNLLGSEPSPKFTTLQAANGTKPVTFDVLDDWGDTTNSGVNNGSLNVNQAGVDAQIAKSGAQFAVSVGDVGYPDGSQTNYGDLHQTGPSVSGVFGPSYWAVPGESIPVFAGIGDHDQGPATLSIWPEATTVASSRGVYQMVSYPSVDGSNPASYATGYYAFSTGGVRFYVLDAAYGYANTGTATGGPCGVTHCAMYQMDRDTHWTPSSAEYQWLAKDLAAHPGGLKIAFLHFPLYSDDATEPNDAYLDNTPGSSGSLEQLLHDSGVQLAFSGHAHTYQRNIAVPGGVTSYVTGGGGAESTVVAGYGCASTDAYAIGWSYPANKGSACGAAKPPATDSQLYNFLKVRISRTTVTVTPVNSLGQTFDVHSYNFAPDTVPPSAPGGLTATQPTTAKTVLAWTPATDNIGVTAYDIYRNGTYLATVGPGVTSYTDTNPAAGTACTYQVAARDLAGNTASASVTVGDPAGTSPPSAPAGLTAAMAGATSVSLSWQASTDNAGVSKYTILRNGTAVATVAGTTTTYHDLGLSPGTPYTYRVTASDAAGNVSQPSNQAVLTTLTAGVLFSDSFETGDMSRWSTVSGVTAQPGLAHEGGYAAWETSTGTPAYAYATLPGSHPELWAEAWVYLKSQATAVNLFGFRRGGGASIIDVYVNASGMLSLRNNIGLVTTYSSTKLPPGGWHLVVLHAVVNGTSSSADVSLDGTTVPGLTLTGQNFGTQPITSLKLGEILTGRSYSAAFDQVAVTQAAP